ncbi:MAG TPA: hypothetical protein VJJ81_04540 [Candidatus Babeliales bacterium]|nr:hypothetical protein [Candidatus Babeliales bacterium]
MRFSSSVFSYTIWFLNLLLCPTILPKAEYLYPVGYHPEQQQFYLLYQAGLSQLKLWSWDPETKVAFPATLSCFNPAGFQFLPDYSGFSFIDHGLIRIKSYNGRLVKTIELLAPLINLNSICWQTTEKFYFCAQSQDYYGIFLADISTKVPQVATVLWKPGVDYLYPQILDQHLFCIKKDRIQSSIVVTLSDNLTEFKFGTEATLEAKAIQATEKPETIELFTTPYNSVTNLKFLQVIGHTQAYFLTQVPARNTQVVSFDCYSLQFNLPANCFETAATTVTNSVKFLFSFDLPSAYFSNPNVTVTNSDDNINHSTSINLRIYESILPFLPRYTAHKIYFCTHELKLQELRTQTSTPEKNSPDQPDLSLQVNIYSYDLASAHITPLTHAKANQLCCGLLILPNGQLCYGGSALDFTRIGFTKSELNEQLNQTTVPFTLDDQWGLPKIELPLLI